MCWDVFSCYCSPLISLLSTILITKAFFIYGHVYRTLRSTYRGACALCRAKCILNLRTVVQIHLLVAAIHRVPRVYVRNRVATAYNVEQLEAETCVAPALCSFLRRSFWLSANTAHPSMFCISWDFPQPSLTVKHTPVTESTVCLPTESATRHKKQHSSTDAEKSTNASVRKAAAAKEPSTERKICTRGKRWSTAWTLWYEYPPCTCSQTRSCSLSTSTYACCFSVFFVTPLSPVKWTTFDLSFKFYWTLAASAESGLSCKLYITLGVPMWRKFWPHFFHFALQVLLFLNIFW